MTTKALRSEARAHEGDAVVCALLAKRPGDNAQVEALADASGLPWAAKRLVFRKIVEALPNLRRGGSLFSLTHTAQASLRGPFPDVVIAAGKRSAPAALWLKAASGGRTKLVHLGRTWAPAAWFDLVITTPQYRLGAQPNLVENRLPLGVPVLRDAPRPDLASLPRPRLVVIVGGDAAPLALDAGTARQLAERAIEQAERDGGSILCATSPRTSRAAVAALRETFSAARAPVRLSVFGDGPNDYRAILAAADRILVTEDSVSMIADAAMTGAPTTVFRLARRFDFGVFAGEALEVFCTRLSGSPALFDGLVDRGLIASNRDIGRFAGGLEAAGLLAGGDAARRLAADELASAAAAIRRLAAEAARPPKRAVA